MAERKLYFYDCIGLLEKKPSSFTTVISEGKLPRKVGGRCAVALPRLSKKLKAGTILDLVVGDPRIIRNAKLLMKGESWKELPKEIRKELNSSDTFWCFRLPEELGNGRMWVNYCSIAKLKS
jgi:hypothetical protein